MMIRIGMAAAEADPHLAEAAKEGNVTDLLQTLEKKKAKRARNWLGDDADDAFACDWRHAVLLCRALSREDGALADYFTAFIISCILVAGVLVGLQTYPSLAEAPAVLGVDALILAIFVVECGVKIVAEDREPWRYWTGPERAWNNFDFVVVVLCLPGVKDVVGGNVSFLRMARLARVAKILKKVPQLQMIAMGLVGGLASIGWITMLLFLVFYMYAIFGVFTFRANDPANFRSLPVAMLTLFRAATLEDWTELMYVNIYGCERYSYGLYESWPAGGAAAWDAHPLTARAPKPLYRCKAPESFPLLSPIYWLSFILLASLVMLSLFIGAITMSMTESMTEMKAERDEQRKLRSVEKQAAALARMQADGAAGGAADAPLTAKELEQKQHDDELRQIMADVIGEDAEEKRRKQARALAMLGSPVKPDSGGAASAGPALSPAELATLRYTQLAARCRWLTTHETFVNFVTVVIVAAGVQVGVQTDRGLMKDPSAVAVLGAIDTAIVVVFASEVVLKLAAEEFEPQNYFRSSWNTFDFVIVVGGFTPAGGPMITMLRLLRLLRVLKLLKSLPQLAMLVNALLKGFSSIGFIGLILLLCYYVFAIVAIELFRENDPWHFGSLHVAMLTLFRVSTLEDWTDVMYINIYGCDRYGYDDAMGCDPRSAHASGALSAVFFIVFVLIASFTLLMLFVGVICTAMDESQTEQKAEAAREARMRELAGEHALEEGEIVKMRHAFTLLDLDGSGQISEDELREGLRIAGMTIADAEVKKIMSQIDENASGYIDEVEFVSFLVIMRDRRGKRKKHRRLFAIAARRILDGTIRPSREDRCVLQVLDEGIPDSEVLAVEPSPNSSSLSSARPDRKVLELDTSGAPAFGVGDDLKIDDAEDSPLSGILRSAGLSPVRQREPASPASRKYEV